MADDLVTFRIDGEVTIDKLSAALTGFWAVLEALHESRGAKVRWVLAGLDYGSAAATAQAVPLDEDAARHVPAMPADYLQAARQVARGDGDPERPVLRAVRELVEFADESNPVVFETGDDEVIFVAPAAIPRIAGAAERQLQTTKSLGSVRGRVEMISQRNALRFSIYELVNDRAVSCYPHPDYADVMREAWGRIADVTGTITRDAATGRPVSIRRVTRVDVVEDEGEPDGYLRARGAIETTEPAEQALRRMRDAAG